MIQSLQRAFQIVRHVAGAEDGLRLAALSELCGLKKTTVYHLAESLVAEGMLAKERDSRYVLGPLAAELHLAGQGKQRLRHAAEALTELHKLHPQSSLVYTELGESDIFGRLNLPIGRPGVVEYPSGMTLNPYLTVCGILYFAFMPADRLEGLRLRHSFDLKGREAWGSEANFQKSVREARSQGWSETPSLTPSDSFKIGAPVRDGNGNLVGTITFSCPRQHALDPEKVTQDALDAAARIAGK